MTLLHIYGQNFQHCDVAIVGSRQAMAYLHKAIGEALETGHKGHIFCQNDGEGYIVHIKIFSNPAMEKLPHAYIDTKSCGPSVGAPKECYQD